MAAAATRHLLSPPAVRCASAEERVEPGRPGAWELGGFEYQEYRPHPALADSVERYWSLRGPGGGADLLQQGVCKGELDLIFTTCGSFCHAAESYLFGERWPRLFFVGPLRHPSPICSTGDLQTVGVRFRSGCAFPFLRYSLFELVDRCVPVEDPWPRARHQAALIAEAKGPRAQLALLEQMLLEQRSLGTLQRSSLQDEVVAGALRAMELRRGQVGIEDLTREVGVGRRQLERKFRDHLGLPPKVLCRILRVQHAASLLAQPSRMSLAAIAQETGYHDQSHFVRDFKALCGTTPSAPIVSAR